MKAFREKLLRSASLPDQRNVLLGRWRVEGATRPKNEKDQFMALLTNPGAGCEMLFGSGITEFASTTFSTSGLAGLAQGPIAYTLLDKFGTVGVDQVRAMARVRYTEAAIEGKVPNTDNLRLDLRGSACGEDPRLKASLYDFDANGMLQSITYVWERPPGPAPAPIFQERAKSLSRFHPSLPQPQTSGRLQGDTSLGRLTLQDMPERNLLLEAYAAKK